MKNNISRNDKLHGAVRSQFYEEQQKKTVHINFRFVGPIYPRQLFMRSSYIDIVVVRCCFFFLFFWCVYSFGNGGSKHILLNRF